MRPSPLPKITVTRYECDHDLLPAVCVRCGAPAVERVPRSLPKPPKAWGCLLWGPLVLIVYLALPFTIMLILWLLPRDQNRVRLPTCAAHRDDWAWRYRVRTRWLWPAICFVSLVVQVICLTGTVVHQGFYAHAAAGVLVVGFLFDQLTLGRREVEITRPSSKELILRGVHQGFVDALIHDRARDRVDNPERRALRGGVQEDYDDEVI